MAATNEIKFSLRVTMDKQKEKVLFAEANSDFADTLISFLTLPLGTIVRLLMKKYGNEAPIIGSLNALYESLENFDSSNFWTERGKLMLLNPKNSFEARLQKLKINIDDTEPTKYFICEGISCANLSMYYSTKCACGRQMNREIMLRPKDQEKIGPGVFTTETSSFIISDDLQLFPNSARSGLEVLRNFGIEEIFYIEETTFLVGFEEIMDLLRLSFISRTPLTDLVFHKTTQIIPGTVNYKLGTIIGTNVNTSAPAIMNVKTIVQKSTGKVILAQSKEDFVDFLYSLLSIPLGRALSLLEGDLSFGSISNLYKSLPSLKISFYGLKIENIFNTAPLPPMYLSKHQPLPLTQQQTPSPLYCCMTKNDPVSFVDPKGCEGSYIKGPAIFTVTDDLIVRPLSTTSGFSVLNSLNITLSDMEEHDVVIGIDEALAILKTSLFSNSVLNCLNFKLRLETPKKRMKK